MPSPLRRVVLLGLPLAIALILGPVAPAAALEECRLLRQPDIQGRPSCSSTRATCGRWRATAASPRGSPRTKGSSCSPSSRPTARPWRSPPSTTATWTRSPMPVDGRRAEAAHLAPGADRSRSGTRTASRILLRSARASTPTRFDRFFKIAATGGFEQMLPLPTAGYATFSRRRQADRVRLAVLRQPHLEALSRRQRARHLDLRLRAQHVREDHRLGRPGRVADVVPGHDLLLLRPRRPHREPVGLRPRHASSTARSRSSPSTTSSGRASARDAIVFENGGYLYVMDLPDEKVHASPGAGARRQAGDARRVPQRVGVDRRAATCRRPASAP